MSQELLDALTAVDNKLSSACLFAEYWDTHSDRDAWFQQHLSSQLHSLAVPLHQWCCDHSASWARGAVHIPVYSSAPTASSSVTTASVTGNKRRYAAITSNGRHRPQPSSSLPPDGPLLSKAAREQEESTSFRGHAQFCCIVGSITWTPSRTQLIHFVFGQANCSPSQHHLCNRAISRYPSSTQLVVQEVLVVGL